VLFFINREIRVENRDKPRLSFFDTVALASMWAAAAAFAYFMANAGDTFAGALVLLPVYYLSKFIIIKKD